MKRIPSAWPALVSASLATAVLSAARPHYGGTLRVQTAITAADPAYRERILPLVFETLTRIGADGLPQPLLARSWESSAGVARWRVRLRGDVMLHNGSLLEPWQAATALRSAERTWRIATDGDALVIDLPAPDVELPSALADMRYAIRTGQADDGALGTGPFRIESSDASVVRLRPYDGYRAGRPFVDSVEIQLGRGFAAQMADLDAGRADLVRVQSTDARRLAQRGLTLAASRPLELVAVAFEAQHAGPSHDALRRAVSASINRRAIADVVLQQQAVPARSVMPAWLSGPSAPSSDASADPRAAVAAVPAAQRDVTLRVDASDPLARAIGERIAVDAREAGLGFKLQIPAGLAPRPDARLVRIRVPAIVPQRSIEPILSRVLSQPGGRPSGQADDTVLVPVVHLPDLYALGEHAALWNEPLVLPAGEWNLAGVWVKPARP